MWIVDCGLRIGTSTEALVDELLFVWGVCYALGLVKMLRTAVKESRDVI